MRRDLRFWFRHFIFAATILLLLLSVGGAAIAREPSAVAGPSTADEALALPASQPAMASIAPIVACEALAGVDFSTIPDAPMKVLSATRVPAGGGMPEYCSVKGYIVPQIQFEMRLPTGSWNGKYFQAGGGGFCGTIPISSTSFPLSRGYAVAAENGGHVGSDALWALNNPDLEIDWGYRSVHVLSLATKAVIDTYYGQAPQHAYFQGCSTGGRQALMEAQRFPEDFDGIISGDPANRQNYLAPLAQGYIERVNRDANRKVILPIDKLPLVGAAVYAACDGIDGLVDGQIDDPRACTFDPESLRCPDGTDQPTCLSDAQVGVLKKLYDSARNSEGKELYPGGLPKGSELGWPYWSVGTDSSLSGGGNFANQVLKYLAFKKDPPLSYDLYQFNFDTDPPLLKAMAKVYNSDDPDMTAFRDRGGKLILYHGWADPLITPYGTLQYYKDAVAAMGGYDSTQQWFRLFLPPGMYHCAGGPGPDRIDWLTPLENWVENGVAPDRIIASKFSGGQLIRTRPVFPFPMVAHYIGSGSIDDADNFTAVMGTW